MKIFIDTANIDEIKDAALTGAVSGVTTNPSLIAKEGKKFEDVIKEICKIVDGPISAEVISLKAEEMIKEAKKLVKLHKNIVIKLPMTKDGLTACSELTKLGVKTNVTLIFSVTQALLAARAGATYVSPFLGRLDDIGIDGIGLIEEIVTVFRTHRISSEIIAASIRNPLHAKRAAMAGADIGTIPYKVFIKMMEHQLTDEGIKKFLDDWNNSKVV